MMLPPGRKSPAVKTDEPKITEEISSNSKLFYKDSPSFMNNRRVIKFTAGSRCSQCRLKSREGNSPHGYCYIHKRIVDMGETCPCNTRNTYKNVNFG
jgi:hypothetical protein